MRSRRRLINTNSPPASGSRLRCSTVKAQSPFKPTFTVELANGYNGYLPTPEQHRLGGYETWRARSSYLEVEAAPKIFDTVMNLLRHSK